MSISITNPKGESRSILFFHLQALEVELKHQLGVVGEVEHYVAVFVKRDVVVAQQNHMRINRSVEVVVPVYLAGCGQSGHCGKAKQNSFH